MEDERVVDLKYTRHSPRLYKHTDVDTKRDDVKSDGTVKLHVGRIHLVIFNKMFIDIQVNNCFAITLITRSANTGYVCYTKSFQIIHKNLNKF